MSSRAAPSHVRVVVALIGPAILTFALLVVLVFAGSFRALFKRLDPVGYQVDQMIWKSLRARPEDAIRFAVIGDYGEGNSAEAAVAAMVKSWQPDFIVTTGDDNYSEGKASTIDKNIGRFYHDYIYPYKGDYGAGADRNRFFPVLGNHDMRTGLGQPYLDYFSMSADQRYYDFVWGPIHFFMLSSDDDEPGGRTRDSIQGRWLQDGLAASTSPWNFVVLHHTPYSSSEHGSIEAVQWPYQEWGADAVLCGHDHVYERIMHGDFPYFVNGLGGGSLYEFNDPVEGSTVRYNAAHGAMLVEATAEIVTLRFYSVRNGGELIDSFTIHASDVPLQAAATLPAQGVS